MITQRKRSSKPDWQIAIAEERIAILFNEAKKRAPTDQKLAQRYVQLAKRIGMRYNVSIPKHLKRQACKYCCSLLPLVQHRVKKGVVVVVCEQCHKTNRYR
ncbi:MAG: hypothetical protein HY832_00515 [Candidatus Aenigmarchaeota archaeon]|nr:hypothetical protein [Candidatus Aenigmarchaeota archaeon]